MSAQFRAGFGRADISPKVYFGLAGFGTDGKRICNNILDRPMITCVAITDEKAFNYDCYEVNARRFPKGSATEVAQIHINILNTLKED